MDPFSFRIVTLDGINYRVADVDAPQVATTSATPLEHPKILLEDVQDVEGLEQTADGRYQVHISLDCQLFGLLVGRHGQTKSRIELETGAELRIPPIARDTVNTEGGEVLVLGKTTADISKGVARVEATVARALKGYRWEYNYFFSLPVPPAAIQQITSLQQRILASPECTTARGVEAMLMQKPQLLHITLAVMKLYSDKKRTEAKQVLQMLGNRLAGITGGKPVTLRLKGLAYFGQSEDSMRVLYIKVEDPSGVVTQLHNELLEMAKDKGLLLDKDAQRDPILHVTLMNASFRNRLDDEDDENPINQPSRLQPRYQQPQDKPPVIPFDGEAILKRFSHEDVGEVQVGAIHLSQRKIYDKDSGYYHCAQLLQLS